MKISDLYHVYAVYDASDVILHQFRNMLINEYMMKTGSFFGYAFVCVKTWRYVE